MAAQTLGGRGTSDPVQTTLTSQSSFSFGPEKRTEASSQDPRPAHRNDVQQGTISSSEVIVIDDSDLEQKPVILGGNANRGLDSGDQPGPTRRAADLTDEECVQGFLNGASVDKIPPPLTVPQQRPVPVKTPVIFHLETTGREGDSHILQIGASSARGEFCNYIIPKRPINFMAASVNRLTFDGQRLLHNLQSVPSVTIRQALLQFLEFLGEQPVTLFAHNAKRFDSVVLLNAVEACDMLSEFQSRVTGFVDTLPLFREIWPGLSSFSQTALYEHFFQSSDTAHETTNDVSALQKLLAHSMATTDDFGRNSFSVEYVLENERRKSAKYAMLPSWQPMVAARSVSKSMAEKAAASGLDVCHLRLAFRRQGKEGVCDVLSQTGSDGKPRVTKMNRILENISSYIALHPTEDKREDDHEDDYDNKAEENFVLWVPDKNHSKGHRSDKYEKDDDYDDDDDKRKDYSESEGDNYDGDVDDNEYDNDSYEEEEDEDDDCRDNDDNEDDTDNIEEEDNNDDCHDDNDENEDDNDIYESNDDDDCYDNDDNEDDNDNIEKEDNDDDRHNNDDNDDNDDDNFYEDDDDHDCHDNDDNEDDTDNIEEEDNYDDCHDNDDSDSCEDDNDSYEEEDDDDDDCNDNDDNEDDNDNDSSEEEDNDDDYYDYYYDNSEDNIYEDEDDDDRHNNDYYEDDNDYIQEKDNDDDCTIL